VSREWGAVSRGKARDGMPGWGARGVVFIVARGLCSVRRRAMLGTDDLAVETR